MDMEELKSADIITAGFPCQDISLAGKGAGLAGERSGLWWQVRRTLRMVRPRYALLENVAALLNRGLSTVLGSLASIGYDTEWHCIPASYVGAPHRRDRIWIIAHTERTQDNQERGDSERGRDTLGRSEQASQQEYREADTNSVSGQGDMAFTSGTRTRDKSREVGDEGRKTTKKGRASIRQEDGQTLPNGTISTSEISDTDKRSGETRTIRAGRKERAITSRRRKGPNVADDDGGGCSRTRTGAEEYDASICSEEVGNATSARLQNGRGASLGQSRQKPQSERPGSKRGVPQNMANSVSERRCGGKSNREDATDVNPSSEEVRHGDNRSGRPIKSFMGGMAHGFPPGMDEHFRVDPADSGITPRVTKDKKIVRAPRLKSLGNAIVKQMATLLGHAIADYNDELHVSEGPKNG